MRFPLLRFGSIAATFFLTTAGTPSVSPGPFDVERVEIAPGTWGFFEKQLNAIVSSNIVAVIGNESVLVYDAGHHPLITRQVVADIKRLTAKPVRYVVISHWHDDHWVAAAEFAKTWPDVQVIAHSFTAAMIETRKTAFRDGCMKESDDGIRDMQKLIGTGKRPDGTPIPAASLERVQRFKAGFEEQRRQCDQRAYHAVDRVMDTEQSLDLGGRTVSLRYLGRGNTAGDLIAYLPEIRTVLTGDLLVAPFPFATQSYISEWARILHTIDGMDVDRIVPGHGPLFRDKQYLHDVTEVLESIVQQARAAYAPGMTLEQLRSKIDLGALAERICHGDAFLKANFNAQMGGSAIDRMYQELQGAFKPEGID